MPIYYVIVEIKQVPPVYFACYHILEVVECDINDRQAQEKAFNKYGSAIIGSGRNIQAMYFYREPANPIRGFNNANI